CQQRNSHPLTF
nr:immunoglobulin light chain junction region [Macaca mulatta]MPN81829.1 immunoglobulin light chain junction region [Macaca mulatta]MPN82619.1 immunoglobulin light chain junction region [Macaca mulatta]MPN82685.1 immunoglobulin light chain junction region [Macaca mulatta]MPN83259.1 immunoglobulin light chain junction region [Macaca mulatta]